MAVKKSSNQSAKVIMCIFAFVIFLLVVNVVYLGATGKHLISGKNMKEYSISRGGGAKEEVLYAKRGTIYSSDGDVIASDVKKYKLHAVLSETHVTLDKKPRYVVDKEKTAKLLAPIIGMDDKKLLERLNSSSYQVEFGQYGNNLSSLVKDQIDALGLTGLEFEEITTRNYRHGDFASYQVGYAQLFIEKSTKSIIGQMGIEKTYEDQLKGSDGKKVYLVDNNNYTLPNGVISEKAPVAGNDLHMTIDTDVQSELELQMEKLVTEMKADKATCAIMDAKTGRILGISNSPSFDPNKRDITNYIDLFLNEAVEPGSVFKSFVYANAITDNKLNVESKYESGKFFVKGNSKPINDHNKGKGWGTITYKQGFYNSSNTAICNILTKLTDKDSLLEDYKDLGFFQAGKVDGLITASGFAGYEREGDRTLEYLNTGFGQGSTFTGYQLLKAYSAFANDGKTVDPYLVEKVVDSSTGESIYQAKSKYSKQIFSTEAVKQTRDLLDGVVNIKGSTGYKFHMDDIRLIGKTGTGQVAKDGGYMSNYYTHSFSGLAPYDDPQVVVVFWYQTAISGNTVASNLVKAVTRVALDKLNKTPTEEVETSTYVLDSYTNQSVEFVNQMLTNNQLVPFVVGDGKTVIDQYPKSKTEVSSKSRVFIQTNGTNITMPSMDGWSRKEAEAFANMANIEIQFEGIGSVYQQSVTKGTKLTSNQKITVKAK